MFQQQYRHNFDKIRKMCQTLSEIRTWEFSRNTKFKDNLDSSEEKT